MMNTAAAALQAHVTAATIRSWCRTRVAATKAPGRWAVNAASLAHRIAIGALRTRKATAVTEPAKPEFAPFTRAEFLRDDAIPTIRVRYYADKHDRGTDLFHHQFPHDRYIAGGFSRTFNAAAQAACEEVLTAAGWMLTTDWKPRLARMEARATRA